MLNDFQGLRTDVENTAWKLLVSEYPTILVSEYLIILSLKGVTFQTLFIKICVYANHWLKDLQQTNNLFRHKITQREKEH